MSLQTQNLRFLRFGLRGNLSYSLFCCYLKLWFYVFITGFSSINLWHFCPRFWPHSLLIKLVDAKQLTRFVLLIKVRYKIKS